MKKLRFLLSLTNDDNDYQLEQAASAQQMADRLGVELRVVFAANDGITQSQQLLASIQSAMDPRPDGIIFEPAGSTALPHVARAAAAAGIGWAVLNREVDYISELRRANHAPIFSITSDHEEIGRIQGRQLMALLPGGGTVLYIHGPGESMAAKQRHFGVLESKPETVQLRVLKAQWTEASAHKAVSSWLRLSTSREAQFEAVCAQDDSMAIGARKAFEELSTASSQRWMKMPFLGCDGLPRTGQAWLRRNLLTATIFIPPNAGDAVQVMKRAIESGSQPQERTLTVAKSIPPIEALAEQSFRARAGV